MDELPIPAHYQPAAEQIRAHLCHLRGGAPFLSPQDAVTLVGWLDAGVPTADVLVAMERAADARRKSRSRFPLTLGQVKRHLGRPPAPPTLRTPGPGEPALGPLLDGVAAPDLRAALEAVGGDPGDEVRALAAIRGFLEAGWAALPEVERAGLLAAAREELGDLVHLVDEETTAALAEEAARDRFRQRWPRLSAAAVRAATSARAP